MGDLHIEILQGQNAALVDLFDLIHARKVLMAFGQAYGACPGRRAITGDQESFLSQTIEGLAQDGRVIPVRLALFAEMVKGRPWSRRPSRTSAAPRASASPSSRRPSARPRCESHQKAAQGVLKALLPESGTAIKGHMRSHDELAAASGYGVARRSSTTCCGPSTTTCG